MRGWFTRLRQQFREALLAHLDPQEVGFGVALGVFVGSLPLYGLHLGICVVLSRRFNLNSALVYGAANISNPLFLPFLLAAEISLGRWIRGTPAGAPPVEQVEGPVWDLVRNAPDLLWSCALGSVVVGALLALVLGLVAYGLAVWRLRRRVDP